MSDSDGTRLDNTSRLLDGGLRGVEPNFRDALVIFGGRTLGFAGAPSEVTGGHWLARPPG